MTNKDHKFTLHTTLEKRKKQHRNIKRDTAWGQGQVNKAVFSKKLLRLNFLPIYLALAILYLMVNTLPYIVLKAIGYSLGYIMYRLMKKRAYVVKRNLELAFPQKSSSEHDKLALQIFKNSGLALFETGIAWYWPNWRFKRIILIDKEVQERALALSASAPRTIVLTCHFMHLEIMARAYALLVRPGVGIYRSSDHPLWEYAQVKGRLKSNLSLVDRLDVRSMVKTLMQGNALWYAPDQDYGTRSSIFVPFFAVKEASTVTGTRDLARIKGTIVQGAYTIREHNKYKLYIDEPLANFPSKDEYQDCLLVNKAIESMIMKAPAQYLWMHRRFKTEPNGAKTRYPDII